MHDMDAIINAIDAFVKNNGKNLSTTQLRNLYGKIRKAQTLHELKLLRPKIAYMIARTTNNNAKSIPQLINDLIVQTDSESKRKSLVVVAEAIVAYHKMHHGRNNN